MGFLRTTCKATLEFLAGCLCANLFGLLFILTGVYLFSALLLPLIPFWGISTQPASVQDTGLDLASLRYIIFESKTWWTPPPSPPPSAPPPPLL